MDSRNENRRGSLRIETYLPVWVQKIEPNEVDRVKSLIADYAVQRHMVDQCEEDSLPEDFELRLLFNKVEKLQKSIRLYFGQVQSLRKHPYVNVAVTLSATGCLIEKSSQNNGFQMGDWLEVHMLLPTHPLDVFVLGQVGDNGAISFELLSPDQEDWIIEYLIHRQQEDIRLKIKKNQAS